uniref:Uncharacterized protein n=1 Tax=Acrobeloides nanus TaxID=290746 RepID=A0A914CAI1_9BILA
MGVEVLKDIREKVEDSNWRITPYRNGIKPSETLNEIITDSFDDVKRRGRYASHCNYYEMYNPYTTLGGLRTSPTYSQLAPTNGMRYRDRYSSILSDLRPYNSYKPKQGEWKSSLEKFQHPTKHSTNAVCISEPPHVPYPPVLRRTFSVPVDPPRHRNFASYWEGRTKGLDYSEPFLYEHASNYDLEENRRYQRLYAAARLVPYQPSARHGRQILLTPYLF